MLVAGLFMRVLYVGRRVAIRALKSAEIWSARWGWVSSLRVFGRQRFWWGGGSGWGGWGLRQNVRSVRVRGPDVGPVEGGAKKGVVVVLDGAWALPVTRAVVYFA